MIATSLVRSVSSASRIVQRQPALAVDRQEVELRAGALRQLLPRHQIRMVLHHAEQDAVARAHIRIAPGARHQVDRLGGVAREDQLFVAARADEARHFAARALEREGGLLAQLVDAAMDIGVGVLVVVFQAHDHPPRLLRRSAAIQKRQRLAIDLLLQDRELAAQGQDIE